MERTKGRGGIKTAWRKCPMKLGLRCLVRGHRRAGLVPLRSQKADLAELGLRPQRRRSCLLWWWSLRSSEGDPPTELGPTSLRSGHFRLCWSAQSSAGLYEASTQTSEACTAQLMLVPLELTGGSSQNWDPDLRRWSPGRFIVVLLRGASWAGFWECREKTLGIWTNRYYWKQRPLPGAKAAAGLTLTGTVGKEKQHVPFRLLQLFSLPFTSCWLKLT